MTSPPTAEQLFARFRETGDRAALALLYDQVAPRLFWIAVRHATHAGEAEDLVQDALLRAIRNAVRFEDGRPVMPWLCGILTNVARERARATDAHRSIDAVPQAGGDPVDRARLAELEQLVAEGAADLDDPYREVVQLHLIGGLAPAEIATTLTRHPNTVRTQLARGLRQLRARLPAGLAPLVAMYVTTRRAWPAMRRRLVQRAVGARPVATVPPSRPAVVAACIAVAVLVLSWLLVAPRLPPSADREQVDTAQGAPATMTALTGTVARRRPAGATPEGVASSHPPNRRVVQRVLVVDAQDRPVADAVLMLHAAMPNRHERDAFEQGLVRVATTDARGVATFDDVPFRQRGRLCFLPGGAGRMVDLGPDRRVTAETTLRLTGGVVDDQGMGVADARVWASALAGGNEGIPVAECDETGAFAFTLIDAARAVVWAASAGCESSPMEVVLQRTGERELSLRVRTSTRRVHGRVIGPDGRAVGGCRVEVFGEDPSGTPIAPTVTRAGEDGAFALVGVPRARLIVIARNPGLAPCHVLLSPDDVLGPIRLAMVRGATIRGRVIDAANLSRRGLVAVYPALGNRDRLYWPRLSNVALVGPRGEFELRNVSPGRVALELISVATNGLVAEAFDVADGEVRTWNPFVDRSRSIVGRVVDEAGQPRRLAVMVTDGQGMALRVLSEAAGTFSTAGLRDGTYRLAALGSPHGDSMSWAERTVRPGGPDFEWRVPTPSCGLELRVTGQPQPRVLRVWRPGSLKRSRFGIGADGAVAASGLPAGSVQAGVERADRSVQYLGQFELMEGEVLRMGEVKMLASGRWSAELLLPDGVELGDTTGEIREVHGATGSHLRMRRGRLQSRRPLAPGRYALTFRGDRIQPIRREFDVMPGVETQERIELRVGTPVRIEVEFDFTRGQMTGNYATVQVMTDRGEVVHRDSYLVRDRELVIELGLGPGRYRAVATADWGGRNEGWFAVQDHGEVPLVVPLFVR
ncbi:MAG: sigma-70 family RNA polymerase sigma factor [Planctomycetota bacterium]